MPTIQAPERLPLRNQTIEGGPGIPGERTLVGAPEYNHDPNDLFARYGSVVDQVVKSFGNVHDPVISKEDLRQEGAIGLLAAARTFDPTRGANFRTYARTCVENSILGAIRRTRKGFKQQPSLDCSNSESGFTTRSVSEFFPTGGDTENHVDRTMPTPEEKIIHREEKQAIRMAMAELPQQQQQTIILRLFEGKSNQEVAQKLGLSAGRVSQIWSSALDNLEKILEKTTS